jgi:hypothetical protein
LVLALAAVSALLVACDNGDRRPTCLVTSDCGDEGKFVCDCPRDTKCTDSDTGADVMHCYRLCDPAKGCPTGDPCVAASRHQGSSICDVPPQPVVEEPTGEPPPSPPDPPF